MIRFDSVAAFDAALADLPAADAAARAAAEERQAQLTKPAGSLGRLEEIALFMAGWLFRAMLTPKDYWIFVQCTLNCAVGTFPIRPSHPSRSPLCRP